MPITLHLQVTFISQFYVHVDIDKSKNFNTVQGIYGEGINTHSRIAASDCCCVEIYSHCIVVVMM